MDPNRVRDHFEEEAREYDASITKLVPDYQLQHEILLQLLPFSDEQPVRFLDLGCGTGVLAHLVARAFPRATGVALDLSENMIAQARRRLEPFGERVEFRRCDFGRDDLGDGYDLIVSGLAIHHLDDEGKRALYRRIFAALRPGGMFLNREVVAGPTPALRALYEKLWREYVASRGVTDDEWFRKYADEDIPAPVEDQVEWLRQAGFVDAACHWRRFNLAIFGGRRP